MIYPFVTPSGGGAWMPACAGMTKRDDEPASFQAERGLVGVEQSLGLLADMALHLAEPDDGPHRLRVIAPRLGFGVDVLDVIGDRLLLFLEPFDPFDQQPQFVCGDASFRHIFSNECVNRTVLVGRGRAALKPVADRFAFTPRLARKSNKKA